MLKFLSEGGWFMYVILGVGILALAFIVERWLQLNFNFRVKSKFFSRVKSLIKDGRLREAYQACLTTSHPLAKVVSAVLYNSNQSPEAIESASDIEIQKVLPGIQKRTGYINMFGNIATLLGLLGTISGLVDSFSSLGAASGAEKGAMLAAGISTAMNTTMFGLIVAIPCIVFYNILSAKEESILHQYDEIISEITHLVVFKPHNEKVNVETDVHKDVLPIQKRA